MGVEPLGTQDPLLECNLGIVRKADTRGTNVYQLQEQSQRSAALAFGDYVWKQTDVTPVVQTTLQALPDAVKWDRAYEELNMDNKRVVEDTGVYPQPLLDIPCTLR